MNYFTICFLPTLFITVYGDYTTSWQYLPKDCGKSRYDGDTTTRIINGDRARLGEFPWMGRLGKYVEDGKLFFFCGGVLINRFYVISAAHCEEKVDIVRLGEYDTEEDIDCDSTGVCAPPHQDLKVVNYYFENFCTSLVNDLMVLELGEPAVFNEFVQPACIPRQPMKYEDIVGNFLTLAGWGRTIGDRRSPSRYLLHISLKVQSVTACHEIFYNFHDEGQICFQVTEKEQNICQGDSGGPAFKTMKVDGVSRAYVFGIASYVKVNCKYGAVYSNILHYMKTILGAVKKG